MDLELLIDPDTIVSQAITVRLHPEVVTDVGEEPRTAERKRKRRDRSRNGARDRFWDY